MASKVTIYHYTRCSKSRQALQLLRSLGIELTIINYQDEPTLEVEKIHQLKKMLNIKSVREMMRHNEDLYVVMRLGERDLSEEELTNLLSAHPILLERPIVVAGDKACIGRPTEHILEIL